MKPDDQSAEETGTNRPVLSLCAACRQPIPLGATICSICKSHQAVWKNRLQYWAGVSTLIVLTLSALVWLRETAWHVLFARDDVRVVSCNSLRSAVVVNRGDSEVYVSHLILTMPGRSQDWVVKRLDFEEPLAPARFLRREFPSDKFGHAAEFVRGLNQSEAQELIARAANGDACLELAMFSEDDAFLRELRQLAGPTLNTFVTGGYLEYRGLSEDRPMLVPISGVGVIRRDPKPECRLKK